MMGQVGSKLRSVEGGVLTFWCPGCEEAHQVHLTQPGRPGWTFNGNLDRPTFQPSVFVKSGHFVSTHKPGEACWCTFNAKRAAEGKPPSSFKCKQCHSFVTDGRIQFLPDSSHPLAGQTVDLPDLPEHLRDPEGG